MPLQIRSIEQLKEESHCGAEFFILLNYNLRSSKRIEWDQEEKRFFVFNLIDDTEQVLTEKQLMDPGYTNIGCAMTKGALYRDAGCFCPDLQEYFFRLVAYCSGHAPQHDV